MLGKLYISGTVVYRPTTTLIGENHKTVTYQTDDLSSLMTKPDTQVTMIQNYLINQRYAGSVILLLGKCLVQKAS